MTREEIDEHLTQAQAHLGRAINSPTTLGYVTEIEKAMGRIRLAYGPILTQYHKEKAAP